MPNNTNYRTPNIPTWCPGCPNYLLLAGLEKALINLKIPSHNLVIAYDIGCAGNMADFLHTYGSHTLHGRCLPFAMGAKIHNPKLTALAVGGDGGIYGEGLNHLISAARMNLDLTVFVSNNYLYSLTTGQTSPTTPKGARTKSTPLGTPSLPIDAIKLLKSVNPDISVERLGTQNPTALFAAIESAIKFKGFSLLEIPQICLAFGKQLSS